MPLAAGMDYSAFCRSAHNRSAHSRSPHSHSANCRSAHCCSVHPEAEGRPPVVLVHGAGGTRLHWPPAVRRLRGFCVFALDLPGHGRSPGPGEQSIAGYGRAALAWLEAAGLERAVWVGHSMGSAICLWLALEASERVLGLGLLGAGARLRVPPNILRAPASPETFQSAVDLVMAWAFGPQAPPRLVKLASKRMAETSQEVLHGDFLACDAFDLRDRIQVITQPSLINCGEHDRMTPARYARWLAEQLPAARLEVMPHAGHMLMLEQPEAVAALLSAFLDEIAP